MYILFLIGSRFYLSMFFALDIFDISFWFDIRFSWYIDVNCFAINILLLFAFFTYAPKKLFLIYVKAETFTPAFYLF